MTCSVCQQHFESEAPDVLTFTKKGAAKLICPHCKEIYETASFARDPAEAEAAIKELRSITAQNHDATVLDLLAEAFPEMESRVAAIRDGSYDFSLDEFSDVDDAIPEEYKQDPEEAAEEERLAEEAKRITPIDRVITALWIVVGIVATISLGFTIYRVLFS